MMQNLLSYIWTFFEYYGISIVDARILDFMKDMFSSNYLRPTLERRMHARLELAKWRWRTKVLSCFMEISARKL